MDNLNNYLNENDFTKETGLSGVSKGNIAVCMHWSGESAMVYVNSEQVFVSSNEQEVIDFIRAELDKMTVSKSNDQYDAEVIASEVIKYSEMKYYNEEDSRGKIELIKGAMSFYKFELPKTIKFSDFQKLVELNLN